MVKQNKVTLKKWHKQWVHKPIIALMAFAFVAAILVTAFVYNKKIETYEKTLNLGSQLIATSLYNKDRRATELIMNNLMSLSNFDWVSVCQNSNPVISFAKGVYRNNDCTLGQDFNSRTTIIPGMTDAYLVAKLNLFELIFPMIIAAIFLLLLAVVLRNFSVKIFQRLNQDLIEPIQSFTQVINADGAISDGHRIYEIEHLHKKIVSAYNMEIEHTKSQALTNLASQVAHDIRSPLSVLNMLVPTLANDPSDEKCELLIQATQRIDRIAEDLLVKGKASEMPGQFAGDEVSKLVSEKKLFLAQKQKDTRIELKIENDTLFKTKLSKLDFERITSNLLNNAIEALTDKEGGLIELGLSAIDNSTVLVIKDNGKGIDPLVLAKIGTKGFTTAKVSGNGLGVYHAKSTVENAGGQFKIDSTFGFGTTVTITI